MAGQRRNDEARREMLAAIRDHLAASAPFDAVRIERRARHGGGAEVSPGRDAPLVERFQESLEAVGGKCALVSDEMEAAEVVRRIVMLKRARRVAVSDSPVARRVARSALMGVELLEDSGFMKEAEENARAFRGVKLLEAPPASELFDCDVGVTGAQSGIAETGTLVLESDRERNRLASLVPPVHVAVVEAWRIRQTLGEVLRLVNEQGAGGLSRAVTLITGPSRTSDIELTLAIGVHGPAELYVVIVRGEGSE